MYELLITAWLKRFFSSDKALKEEAPTLDWDEIGATLTEDGEDTEQTAVIRKEFNELYRVCGRKETISLIQP